MPHAMRLTAWENQLRAMPMIIIIRPKSENTRRGEERKAENFEEDKGGIKKKLYCGTFTCNPIVSLSLSLSDGLMQNIKIQGITSTIQIPSLMNQYLFFHALKMYGMYSMGGAFFVNYHHH